jgi:phage RecT family recombinase
MGKENQAITPIQFMDTNQQAIATLYDSDDFKKFRRSAIMAFEENYQLQDCLKTREGQTSVYHAMNRAASTGLSLNPLDGKAALVAYKGKCTYQVMKEGLIDLAFQSGVKNLNTGVVRENDDFKIIKSTDGDKFEHSQALTKPGEIIGFYASAQMPDGEFRVEYMTREAVNEVRDSHSSMYRFKPESSPWSKSYPGMGIKTVVKALFRNSKIGGKLKRAISADDSGEADMITVQGTVVEKGTTPEALAENLGAEDDEPTADDAPAVTKKKKDTF